MGVPGQKIKRNMIYNNITRAETVTMICRLFNRSEKWNGSKSFIDVPQSHWAYNNIMNAVNGNED